MSDSWWVYVLECERGVLYTGIARDVEARFAVHLAGKGAAFTKRNRPVRILARTAVTERGVALRLEYDFKQLPRDRKLWWCEHGLDGFPRRDGRTSPDADAGSA